MYILICEKLQTHDWHRGKGISKRFWGGGPFIKRGVKGGPTDDYPPHKLTPQRSRFIREGVLIKGRRLV